LVLCLNIHLFGSESLPTLLQKLGLFMLVSFIASISYLIDVVA